MTSEHLNLADLKAKTPADLLAMALNHNFFRY